MYHPLHWVLYRFLPLPVAFNLELLFPYPFMLIGMYLLMRRWELRRDACMLGALAVSFSGYSLLHHVWPHVVAVTAHAPWLLLAMDVALRSSTAFHVAWGRAGVAVLTASQSLLGFPQSVWFSLLLEGTYLIALGGRRGG